jgi:transcriptional regulator with XRE-family HTH domain
MDDLRKRFGKLLAAHRRERGWTQGELAERAQISIDMVSKLETGSSGARFPVIERLADTLQVDPAELFTTELPKGAFARRELTSITSRLASLSDNDLAWIGNLIDSALDRRKP